MASYPVPMPRRRNWFERNWIWLIPAGVVAVIGMICAFVFGLIAILGNSDACRMAVARAQQTPAITEQLGTPIKRGWLVSGNINVQAGGSGEATLSVPISGPKGKGTLYAEAKKEHGQWAFESLQFTAVDGRKVDLLAHAKEPVQTEAF